MYELQNEINGCIRNFPNRKMLSRAMAGNRTVFVPSSQLQLKLASSIWMAEQNKNRLKVSEWAKKKRKILDRVNLSHGIHITHAYPFWRTRHAPSIPNRIAFYNLQKKKCSLHSMVRNLMERTVMHLSLRIYLRCNKNDAVQKRRNHQWEKENNPKKNSPPTTKRAGKKTMERKNLRSERMR